MAEEGTGLFKLSIIKEPLGGWGLWEEELAVHSETLPGEDLKGGS